MTLTKEGDKFPFRQQLHSNGMLMHVVQTGGLHDIFYNYIQ